MLKRALLLSLIVWLTNGAWACELCAIYNADTAASGSGKGFSFAVSEEYIPFGTVQLNGRQLPPSVLDQTFVNTSMTHFVPTWSFSKMFGVSLSFPVVHKEFKFLQLTGTGVQTESGQATGLGDISLIGRCRVFQASRGMAAISINLLAGVKFPTGDAERLSQEVTLTRELDAIYGVGHQHSVSGVHLSDLALGSGSYDGVFGLTVNSHWQRFFCNAQFQYYLRTPGEAGYQFGNEWMISGGPGVYLFLHEALTLSLQTLATYDSSDPDILLARQNRNTGMTAVYLGPQLYLTLGERFTANAGVDLPISIGNNGLQNVPDYRFHAGVSFRF
jgi:hypothetical protein